MSKTSMQIKQEDTMITPFSHVNNHISKENKFTNYA